MAIVKYIPPNNWAKYDEMKVLRAQIEAENAVRALSDIPIKRAWFEELEGLQLKREVAGTSRIEGAEFTEMELDAAMSEETPSDLFTRSQRQAVAVKRAYRWIGKLPDDYPVNEELILDIHRRIIIGADDDRVPPGKIRGRDQNVTFGIPKHRGVEGGAECQRTFERYCQALTGEIRELEPLLQALAAHYHLGAMHPFLDGNGRTERALEAFYLQRTGLRGTLFIAMSNYYYEEKDAYLGALAETRANNHDLTPFFLFGLEGISRQCDRLRSEFIRRLKQALILDTLRELSLKAKDKRRGRMVNRQIEMVETILGGVTDVQDLTKRVFFNYGKLKKPIPAIIRDLNSLTNSGLVTIDSPDTKKSKPVLRINMDWPAQFDGEL